MTFPRRYTLAILGPPLAVALPAALWFLFHVTRMDTGTAWRTGLAAVGAYLVGSLVAGRLIAAGVQGVEDALAAGRDPSASLSRALEETTLWSAVLWIAWGLLAAITGLAFFGRTFLGIQYFGEAAMIIAAPSMAWAYWSGKHLLLSRAVGAPRLEYRGRVWSVGIKIAIVFIGFFVVSSGALILLISSRVSARLGDEMAYEIGRLGLMIAVVTSAAFAVATWFLAHDIIRPLQEMVRLAGEMAEGKFQTDPRIFADDEVGRLAGSFAVTRRNVKALLARIGERGESLSAGARSMAAGTESLVGNALEQNEMAARSSEALTVVQTEARTVVDHVGNVASLTAESSLSAAELRASFGEVARRMDELFRSVEKSSSAATEINASARETASRASDLASIGNDVLAFVSQMDATVGQIMQTAQSTAGLSEQVRSEAHEGRSAVEATVAGIRKVQESSGRTAGAFEALQKSLGKIDQILALIDDVTNRTNLLSLNAAIIAAQAGMNDFGFSVIADEVRQLADRTRTATKEIAEIIRGVQPVTREALAAIEEGTADVGKTVHLAHDASRSLDTILASSGRSLEMTRSMSTALAEQAKASNYLHGVTSRLSDNIAVTRRAAEGQAESTRLLAVEAELVSGIALQVKRATEEQTVAANSIAAAMEQVANGIASTGGRLEQQLRQADHIAAVSRETLAIAERNRRIAEQFRISLDDLLASGHELEKEVSRYRA